MPGQRVIFEYPEDRRRFEELLCDPGEEFSAYDDLFDFRPPAKKRREFDRCRDQKLEELVERYGRVCLLAYAKDCDVSSGLCVDHLIPISSSKLNKELRGTGTSRTLEGKLRKAPTQSFGSNKPRNLVLACVNCNSLKMNRILPREVLKRVLRSTGRDL